MGAPARAGELATEDPTGPLTSTGSVGTADYPGLIPEDGRVETVVNSTGTVKPSHKGSGRSL